MASTSVCPLCQQPNQCTSNESCWCFTASVPKELIERLPENERNIACICQRCVREYLNQPSPSEQ